MLLLPLPRVPVALALGLVLWDRVVEGSNWAQVTGPQLQDYVIPRNPNRDMFDSTKAGNYPGKNDHWSARRGHAVVVTPKNDSIGVLSRVFILGGDSYVHNSGYLEHGGQYLNDVWYSEGVKWKTVWSYDDVDAYKKKYQRTFADMWWEQSHKGRKPPVGVSYDDWIQCQPAYDGRDDSLCTTSYNSGKAPGIYTEDNMWSPRRNLGAVFHANALWVMGGRSRSFTDIDREDSVGGILGPPLESDLLQSKYREPSLPMNDVWTSLDYGLSWSLVTPGCKAPQLDQILAGNARDGKYGSEQAQCQIDSDCYGNEYCNTTMSTCVCNMWSAREQHAVVAHGQYMYVVGGFTSPQLAYCGAYACGDPWASAYTGFMQDVWRSSDGVTWELITAKAGFPGRGGHGVVVAPELGGMFLVGGQSGDNYHSSSKTYLNDVWFANLTSLDVWTSNFTPTGFAGRAGFSLVYEPPTAENRKIKRLYVIGGENQDGVLKDVWVWGFTPDRPWAQDYSPEQFYHRGSGSTFSFAPGSPHQYYVDANTTVDRVAKITLPVSNDDGWDIMPVSYLTDSQVQMLHKVGINTVTDMAYADQFTILRLRGFDYPQVAQEDRMTFTDVCNFRALCLAILSKCQIHDKLTWWDGKKYLPRNIRPRFRKGWPKVQHAQWYGVDYTKMNPSLTKTTATVTDTETLIREWDGCSRLPDSLSAPNVPGLGIVDQVNAIRNPSKEVNELHCKTNPFPRSYLVGTYFQDKVFLFGGKHQDNGEVMPDTWYRDDRVPTAYIASKPATGTSSPKFYLTADEEVAFFEYRIYNVDLFEEVKGWTKCSEDVDISWMNIRKGGPGTGNYIFYARAVDPAGNRDNQFIEGLNMHTWHYKNPLNWPLILSLGGVGLVFLFAGYMEYRRRMKKRAMERYALKRMRRKFKGMQKDMEGGKKTTDWRDLRKEKKKTAKKDKDKKTDTKKSTTSKKKSPKDKKKDKDKTSSSKSKDKKASTSSSTKKKDTTKKKKDK